MAVLLEARSSVDGSRLRRASRKKSSLTAAQNWPVSNTTMSDRRPTLPHLSTLSSVLKVMRENVDCLR